MLTSKYSADAQRTPVTATFTPNPSDITDVTLKLTYTGGSTYTTDLTNMAAFGKASVWRIDIGTGWDS